MLKKSRLNTEELLLPISQQRALPTRHNANHVNATNDVMRSARLSRKTRRQALNSKISAVNNVLKS